MRVLNKKFYSRDTLTVARDLLGKYIVRKIGNKKLIGAIVEVEAYNGPNDLASHASRGETERNKIMFGHPGFSYVYMIYGLNYCFNIVTESRGYPAAVLIRAIEPVEGVDKMIKFRKMKNSEGTEQCPIPTIGLTNGPGKFCQAFKINKDMNAIDLAKNKELWLEDGGVKMKKADIVSAKRIGVDYAGDYKDKLWRFYLKGNKFVSKI